MPFSAFKWHLKIKPALFLKTLRETGPYSVAQFLIVLVLAIISALLSHACLVPGLSHLLRSAAKVQFRLSFTATVRRSSAMASQNGTDKNGEKTKFERLPAFARPQHYAIRLKPDLDKFTFDGEAKIKLVTRIRNNVLFHFLFSLILQEHDGMSFLKFNSSELEIDQVWLASDPGNFLCCWNSNF